MDLGFSPQHCNSNNKEQRSPICPNVLLQSSSDENILSNCSTMSKTRKWSLSNPQRILSFGQHCVSLCGGTLTYLFHLSKVQDSGPFSSQVSLVLLQRSQSQPHPHSIPGNLQSTLYLHDFIKNSRQMESYWLQPSDIDILFFTLHSSPGSYHIVTCISNFLPKAKEEVMVCMAPKGPWLLLIWGTND